MSINIIGINGYIGSGKDTVGKLVQYLAIEEKERNFDNGWTKVYDFETIQRVINVGKSSGWEIKKYASKLKQIASLLTGISVEKFEDQEFKKSNLGPEWNKWVVSYSDKYDSYKEEFDTEEEVNKCIDRLNEEGGVFIFGKDFYKMTVREFLQKLGTEAIRMGIHPNAWVNALFADYQRAYEIGADSFEEPMRTGNYPKWIITDCRFPNEAQAIKDRGGIVVRVDRKEAAGEDAIYKEVHGNKFWVRKEGHASETSLDDWAFDHIIDNNFDITQLRYGVKYFLNKFNIVKDGITSNN